MRFIYAIVLFVLLLMFGCNQDKMKLTRLNSPVLFYSDDSVINSDFFDIYSSLGANLGGDTLVLQFVINNKLSDTVFLSSSKFELENTEGIRSHVIPHDIGNEFAEPKSRAAIKLRFAPVNNLQLYHLTGRHGVTDSSYTLRFTLPFGSNIITKDISFKLLDYNEFKQQKDRESDLMIYNFSNPEILKEQLVKTFASFEKSKNVKNAQEYDRDNYNNKLQNIKVSDSEILLEGLVIKMQIFRIDGTLHIRSKIINHGAFDLRLNTSKMLIYKEGRKTFDPIKIDQVITSEPKLEPDVYLIRKSGRLEFSTQINDADSDLKISLDGFIYNETETKIFSDPLDFYSKN